MRIASSRKILFKRFFADTAVSGALLCCAVLFFGLAHPNAFTDRGVPVFSYFAFVPVFLLTRRVSWKFVWLAGLVYGVGSYWFYAYWFKAFLEEEMIFYAGLLGLGGILLLVFPLLKLCCVLYPKNGWIAQWIVWTGYEYLKTLGYAGFHYGVTAYTHWRITPLIQITDIAGVWPLSALIVFVSAWLSAVLSGWGGGARSIRGLVRAASSHRVSGCVWVLCFVFALVYGVFARVDYSKDRRIKVALIQPNSDPWLGGVSAIRRDLRALMRLSTEALREEPGTELVVWPETAFVPRIVQHYRMRTDRERFDLVRELLQYIDSAGPAFVIGNDHAEEGYDKNGRLRSLDYNSALLFFPGKNVIPPEPAVYRKMHLVPFTEYFPYEKQFPTIYENLLGGDTHMWEPGKTPVVFSVPGLRFSSPICFEDTFGYIARNFVRNGAQAIVNMSNDAWAKSRVCQNQHLSMALFRSVENRVASIRATASGETVIIDPNGNITARAEPFAETWVTGEIPVMENRSETLYTKTGDWFGVLAAASGGGLLAAGIIRKGRNYGKKPRRQ